MLDGIVISLAKHTLLHHFSKEEAIDKHRLLKQYPQLSQKRASFVTLHKRGALRGCIGSIIAHRSLYDDIVSNTLMSAFRDSRFSPLKEDELSELSIEVSILSNPKEIEYSSYEELVKKITPNEDGLILEFDSYHGTFLPQVWQQLPKTKDFLEHLSFKAGADPSIYTQKPKILRYRVEAIEAEFDEIASL
ncbi:MAG: AmmeMemoRadiSam system protein A [Sulfurimonas sp.]|uniref:AmmeMemoRadiSam system protein A n=1 Tax=Sulfurimonas sp. TaxID=2022749 RepID=UPI0025DBE3C4|nr:AmmeMemoRadiSam system protein A [Sulfurimonas sp.]MCK9491661.1 AmmeMemoRadiSam system protein A [Sulfurimonas sp.]